MGRRGRDRLAYALVGLVVVAGAGLLLWPARDRRAAAPETLGGVVRFAYDGDTVEVVGVGKVRLIGIDAMDGYNVEKMLGQSRRYGLTAEQVKRWAGQATAFAAERLASRPVTLAFGPEREDRYGRTLAYVDVPGAPEGERDFGLLMLDRGLAAAYHAFPHPRLSEYRAAERKAQQRRAGMWQDARVRP